MTTDNLELGETLAVVRFINSVESEKVEKQEDDVLIMYTVNECLQHVKGISKSYLYRIVKEKKLHVIHTSDKKNAKILIPKCEIDRYMKGQ